MIEGLIVALAWFVLFMAALGAYIAVKHAVGLVRLMFFDRSGNSGTSGSGHWWEGKEHD